MSTTATGVFQRFLANKVVLVTGSTKGIGYAIAKQFALAGADVVLHGRSAELADAAVREGISACGGRVMYCGGDLSDRAFLKDMVARVEAEMGRLDILVNNAGIQHVVPFADFPVDWFEKIIDVNLTVPFLLMQHVIPAMRSRGYGRLINIASVQGLVGSKHKSAYNAAKHGLMGLTKSIALDFATEDITCNAVCPGFVLTAMVERQIAQAAQERFKGDREAATAALLGEKTPSMTMVKPEAIGDAAVFLCTPAASQMKGTSIVVDGGWATQ